MTKSTNFFTFCKKNYANLLNSAPNREAILQCNAFFCFHTAWSFLPFTIFLVTGVFFCISLIFC